MVLSELCKDDRFFTQQGDNCYVKSKQKGSVALIITMRHNKNLLCFCAYAAFHVPNLSSASHNPELSSLCLSCLELSVKPLLLPPAAGKRQDHFTLPVPFFRLGEKEYHAIKCL